MNATAELAERLIEERSRRVDVMQRLWKHTMATADTPSVDQFYVWARLHDLETMLFSIDRTAKKRMTLRGRMDMDFMVRYCSKCANNFSNTKEKAA